MREFILRALKGKTTPDFSLDDLPNAGRMDLVCRCVSNALWISNDLRRDTIIHVAMDGPSLPPKIVSFNGLDLKGVRFDERDIAKHIQEALKRGKPLEINEEADVSPGIKVAKKSFEALVKEKSKTSQLFYLHKKGGDIREAELKGDVTFVFGDYIGMPRNTESLLDRLGAKKLTLGPVMLFASHCIIVAHNELDRKIV
ncbi:MAG: tRNA (pseudouridine(54)-N(1))-methyltransferase TrmY [Nanoarchaeota archaeon]